MVKKQILLIGIIFLLFFTSCQTNSESTETAELIETNNDGDEMIVLPEDHLQKGDQSNAVNDLQHILIEIGYPVNQSGIYDELTTWAITDIQLQDDHLNVTGIYDDKTRSMIASIMNNEQSIAVGSKLEKPTHPDQFTEVVENPYEILALVNKSYSLPEHFEPDDLTVPNVRFPFDEDDPKKQLRQVAASSLEEMFNQADEAGVELYAQSGFRSFARQEAIFAANVDRHGEDKANTYSAKPGESEHQTGLVMDVTSRTIGFTLEIEFENTIEGQWINDHAHEFGFIIRYPKGKETITKYQYEPWHLRYVGQKAAIEMKENDLTLEEYLEES